jgi:hypothetical protein
MTRAIYFFLLLASLATGCTTVWVPEANQDAQVAALEKGLAYPWSRSTTAK